MLSQHNGQGGKTATAPSSEILGRTVIFASAGAAAAPGLAFAQQSSAQAFLEAIYKPYLDKYYPGQNYDYPGRFIAPNLARAMKADATAAARRREVPLLDGDPFVDAQDWEITKLAIAVVPKGTTAATATVTFANHGKATRLLIELEQTPAGWRIADIKAPSGSLRALYKLRP